MGLVVNSSCRSHHLIGAAISLPLTISPSPSKSMAMASSFCPRNPFYFKPKPISCFRIKPFQSRAFSAAQGSDSPSKDGMPARIGFLGLGIMGSPMAQNLIKAGCDVTVWNRTKSKCDPLISLGAKYKSSPEEVASSCDVTFSMLADPESAVDIACGKHGAASGMAPGKGYVDISTVDGATSKLISSRIKSTGALFLEAPVSGSKKPAEDGQLIFLTAGDKSLFDTASPFLDIMGKSRFYLGDVGNGAAMKLVVNMIMGSMMASFSEGLCLSEKVGLDPSVLVQVISQGAISAPMYAMKGPSMVQSIYPTAFPLKHQQKVQMRTEIPYPQKFYVFVSPSIICNYITSYSHTELRIIDGYTWPWDFGDRRSLGKMKFFQLRVSIDQFK